MRIYEDLRAVQARVVMAQYVIVAVMATLLSFFWHLQVVRGREFRLEAERNRTRIEVLAAPRGTLLDRHGRILVENRPAFNIVMTPEHCEGVDRTVVRLSRLLSVSEARIRERLAGRIGAYRPVVVKAGASFSDVASLEARRLELPGVSVDVVPLRSYPLAAAAAHTLGRVGEVSARQLRQPEFAELEPGDLVGQAGLEAQYNKRLMGKEGYRRVVVNSRGIEVGEAGRQPSQEGPSLALTLDAKLQTIMERVLAGKAGSAAALDPYSGEILGLSSVPAFDPNGFSLGLEHSAWQRLRSHPWTPLMNRAIQGQYAPGSLFKVVVAIAGLEEGVITPATKVRCRGAVSLYDKVFHCNKRDGHGQMNVHHALEQSCNVFFYQLGKRLTIDRIAHYAKRLGLGAPTGADLPHEATGLIPDPEWKLRVQNRPWYAGETVSVAIGQGQVTATPLQMARLAAAIGNGGSLPHPHLVASSGASPLSWPVPTSLGLKPATIDVLRGAMRAVVASGTGWRAALPGVAVAGKTGSAQVVRRSRKPRKPATRERQAHGWFMAFAPAARPSIALAVIVEHGGSGGVAAAPLARKILAAHFEKSPAPEATPRGD